MKVYDDFQRLHCQGKRDSKVKYNCEHTFGYFKYGYECASTSIIDRVGFSFHWGVNPPPYHWHWGSHRSVVEREKWKNQEIVETIDTDNSVTNIMNAVDEFKQRSLSTTPSIYIFLSNLWY